MARTLLLKYMGNELKFYIPDFNRLATGKNDIQTISELWSFIGWEPNSPNIPVLCGYAGLQTQLSLDYYQLIRSTVGDSGHKCKNMYVPYQNNWDEDWPEPCGTNKILIPPNYGDWICPANERYVQFTPLSTITPGSSYLCTANVYDKNDTIITQASNGSSRQNNFRFAIGNITFSAVNDWDGFRNAATFNDAKSYCNTITVSLTSNGIWAREGSGGAYDFLRLLWDLTRVFGGDDDDPTEPSGDDPYSGDDSPYDPSSPDGGEGDGADPYDPGDDIDYPDDPPFSIADTGLMNVYIPSAVQLNLLAAYLWSNNFINSMVKDVYADPMDVILSLGVLPFNITASGTANIKVGDRDSEVSSNVPSNKYINIDCGSVDLKTTIGAYIDYAPYTKGDIFIPYVGFVPLDIDAFMKHSIGLKYKVEICTGTAIAFLLRDGKVWQTFACNLMTPIPLSSANYGQMWQTVVGATAALAGAGAIGAAGMGAAAGAGEMAEGAHNISQMSGNAAKASSGIMSAAATKPTIQKSNNISVLAGILVNHKPFIQLHRPNLMLPTDQKSYQGYPSYIECQLSSLSGYTRVSSINLAVASATGRELKMIDAILKTGFIIGNGTNISGNGIVLGYNTSPAHQINKAVTTVATLTGAFRDSVDIINPVVRIEHDSPIDFNYVYISAFNRYYFVEDITIVRKGIMDITLSDDVLESHKAGILANNAIIDKQANTYNLYLNDDSIKMRQDPLTTCYEFPNGFFENDDYEFVLCVAGN